MLEWLKTILGEAHTEEIDKKVSDEIGKNFVSRTDFNTTKGELKTAKETILERDGQLEALRKSTDDVATLQQTITGLQKDNADKDKTHAEALKQLKIENAVDAALAAAHAKNPKAVKALLELKEAELRDDGTVRGLEDQLKALAAAEDSGFLFQTEDKQGGFKGFKPGEGGDNTPPPSGKKTEEMTYEELCAHLEAHPDAKLN